MNLRREVLLPILLVAIPVGPSLVPPILATEGPGSSEAISLYKNFASVEFSYRVGTEEEFSDVSRLPEQDKRRTGLVFGLGDMIHVKLRCSSVVEICQAETITLGFSDCPSSGSYTVDSQNFEEEDVAKAAKLQTHLKRAGVDPELRKSKLGKSLLEIESSGSNQLTVTLYSVDGIAVDRLKLNLRRAEDTIFPGKTILVTKLSGVRSVVLEDQAWSTTLEPVTASARDIQIVGVKLEELEAKIIPACLEIRLPAVESSGAERQIH